MVCVVLAGLEPASRLTFSGGGIANRGPIRNKTPVSSPVQNLRGERDLGKTLPARDFFHVDNFRATVAEKPGKGANCDFPLNSLLAIALQPKLGPYTVPSFRSCKSRRHSLCGAPTDGWTGDLRIDDLSLVV